MPRLRASAGIDEEREMAVSEAQACVKKDPKQARVLKGVEFVRKDPMLDLNR